MKFLKLFYILLFYISACSIIDGKPILEQEYMKNEKENFWLTNGLKRQIDNIGNRPLDVEISDRLEPPNPVSLAERNLWVSRLKLAAWSINLGK
jgi:hypothetical protein